MITQTHDDVAIVLNGKDTVSDTTKRFDIQKKGVSKFSVTNEGSVVMGSVLVNNQAVPLTIKKTIGAGGIKAQGTITVSGTPVANETMVIGETTYTFKAARAEAGEITIDADNATQVTNIVTAITEDSTDVTAADGTGDTVVVTAAEVGTAGNDLIFTEAATGVAMDGSGKLGGTTAGVDIVDADFNFTYADNKTEQVIDLGAIIPARARVVDIYLITDSQFTGASTLVADVGNASGGNQFISSATIYEANAVLAMANNAACPVAPNVEASHVYVNATPGANWSLVGAGKVSVYVTYIDVSNL